MCLPTGYGKSVCYQVLPFLMDHKHNRPEGTSAILVVSPLLALMEDQVSGLRRRKVSCSIISGSPAVAKEKLCDDRSLFRDSIFFLAPEAVVTPRWRAVFEMESFARRIVAIAIDEAHCVSKWIVILVIQIVYYSLSFN